MEITARWPSAARRLPGLRQPARDVPPASALLTGIAAALAMPVIRPGDTEAILEIRARMPIPSPALLEKKGTAFRAAVASFAEANHIAVVRFKKEDRKAEVMAPYLRRQAATGRSGVAAIGVSQEFQRVGAAYRRETRTAAPQYTFAKADRRVTCYYFYLWDEGFGLAFIKVCAYFPYPAKVWLNGHEWAKRQALRAGIRFTELTDGFAACDDPALLQKICDRLQPGTIDVFAQRWLHRLPMPFSHADQRAGYWWELSMRQVEVSRTPVFDAPRRARAFFEALIADNLDIGRPASVEIIFSRHIHRNTPGVFRTAIDRPVIGPDSGGVIVNVCSSTPGSSSTRTAARCGSRPSSTHLATSAATPACPTSPNSRTRPARSTGAYWKPSAPARAPSSRAQPSSGSRTRLSMRTGGGPRPCGSAIPGSRP